jgi:outer membrane biosynthesis protein TonB
VETELEFGESELQVEMPEDDAELQEGADQATAARTPDTGARLLKNVQPTYPSAARQEDVRARIKVEVRITETGHVEEATIRRRWRVLADGSSRPVQTLGYGLEEAAIAAAQRSLFRPAQASGQPVATRTVLTFTFGRD